MLTVLSNVTIGSPFFLSKLRKLTQEQVAVPTGYNTWIQQLLNPDADITSSKAVFLLLDGAEIFSRKRGALHNYAEILQQYLDVISGFLTEYPDTPLFVSSLDIPQQTIVPLTGKRLELSAMSFWRENLSQRALPVVELQDIAASMGREQFYSPSMWYYGSLPFSMRAEKALAAECARCLQALLGRRKKCLILDLDNTLWGGVVGEDGPDGITLGNDKEGAIYRDVQRVIADLKEMGVLLAIASKNNHEDALAGLAHPGMVLKPEDFISIKANWSPKSTNIMQLADDLNLGLDSFVFVDDNPVEREAVNIAIPEVAVPEFPGKVTDLPLFFRQVAAEYFPLYRITTEDRNKSEQYRTECQRKAERQRHVNLDEYLASLQMRLKVWSVGEADVARVAQMTQKTNQFNLTTRRYTEADIRSMMRTPGWHMWVGELEDRFGNYGKIILCLAFADTGQVHIDTFLMSCRVMGRGVEQAFVQYVQKQCAHEGMNTLRAEFIPSAKNIMAKNFWQEMGFTLLESDSVALEFEKTISAEDTRAASPTITMEQL